MFAQIKKFWLQPYPDSDEFRSLLGGAILVGLVVFFVLAAFRPFGLFRLGDVAYWYALQFGVLTSLISLCFDLLLKHGFGIRKDQPRWTFGKWVISSFVLMLLIALGNVFLIQFQVNQAITFQVFLNIWFGTMLVGVVPMLIYGALQTNRNLQTYRQLASDLSVANTDSSNSQMWVKLGSALSDSNLELSSESILYLESQRNYVKVVYVRDGKVEESRLRGTLSAIEQELHHTAIKRSHRSYLVNPHWINQISGNAQGLMLSLKAVDGSIYLVPVSRTYIPDFR